MLGSIGKLAGQLSEGAAGRGDVGQVLENALRELGSSSSSQSKVAQRISAAINAAGLADKMAFIAVLNGAIRKAAKTPHFNIETQINDLWIALSALRSKTAARNELNQLVQQRQEMMQTMTNIVKQFEQSAQNAIQNMR